MRGRPKKPPDEVKDFMLRVRLTQEQKALLDSAASLKEVDLSSWVRDVMLALARRLLKNSSTSEPGK